MYSWHQAAVFCEEVYEVPVDTYEGFFICPECGEPIYEVDWDDHPDWTECPICGSTFAED